MPLVPPTTGDIVATVGCVRYSLRVQPLVVAICWNCDGVQVNRSARTDEPLHSCRRGRRRRLAHVAERHPQGLIDNERDYFMTSEQANQYGIVDQVIPNRIGRVAEVASVSAGAHQPEGARRGGKEAAEVACADRDEGASEAQAAEEDLARQVETRHACPAALRGVAYSAAST